MIPRRPEAQVGCTPSRSLKTSSTASSCVTQRSSVTPHVQETLRRYPFGVSSPTRATKRPCGRWTTPKCSRSAARFMAACRSSHGNPLVGGPGHVLDPARVVGTRDSRLDDFAIVDDRRISDDLPRAVEIREAITDAELDRRSEEHTSELQSRGHLVCRLLLE